MPPGRPGRRKGRSWDGWKRRGIRVCNKAGWLQRGEAGGRVSGWPARPPPLGTSWVQDGGIAEREGRNAACTPIGLSCLAADEHARGRTCFKVRAVHDRTACRGWPGGWSRRAARAACRAGLTDRVGPRDQEPATTRADGSRGRACPLVSTTPGIRDRQRRGHRDWSWAVPPSCWRTSSVTRAREAAAHDEAMRCAVQAGPLAYRGRPHPRCDVMHGPPPPPAG